MFNYHVTAHRPTAVSRSLVANFTGPDDVNLVVVSVLVVVLHSGLCHFGFYFQLQL